MRQFRVNSRTRLFISTAALAIAGLSAPAFGQEVEAQSDDRPSGGDETSADQAKRQSSADALTNEITVTGRRIGQGEALQDAPVAVTAFGEAQLEAAYVRDLQGLSYAIPNVALDTGGAFPGVANFSIRGLGVVGTVPSIDPTVGVLVDGVYLGSTYGVLTDIFDLEGIEVLRGPQGVAFGKNVTGGAILVKTKAPTDYFEGKFRATLENGPNYGVAGAINVPLGNGVAARLTSYYKNDEGYFKSSVSDNFGESETFVIRPSLRIAPTDAAEMIFRYEHGKITGDASVWQNADFSEGFDTPVNSEGSNRLRWDQFTAEVNIKVGLFDGTITNIFGYRDVSQDTFGTDFDGREVDIFQADIIYDQDQLSNELRFSGTPAVGVQLTVGAYYFEQNLDYYERRNIAGGAIVGTLGGRQESWTAAGFAAVDVDVTDTVTLNLGLRYTTEEKTADIATYNTVTRPCNLETLRCAYDFSDTESWDSWMPKIGLQWRPNDNFQVYGYWARGFRSGGYNFRSFNPGVPPGPYDQETQDSFELGFKSDLFDRKLRLNGAVFWNELSDLQRDINFPDPVSGNAQVIRNSADARIRGVELEFTARPFGDLVLTGTLGYTDADYTDIFFDLNSDGAIDQADQDLDLVRVAPWTFGLGANYEVFLEDSASIIFRGNYSHRDQSAAQDPNNAFLTSADLFDASVILKPSDADLSISIFGRNLTNEKTWNSASLFGFGLARQINKGRTYGIELSYGF